nr:hypothetical protein OH837_46750 [Streptomyces canus]
MPAGYNDLFVDPEIRDHVGVVWYDREVRVPRGWTGERVALRFGSVTYAAQIYGDERLVAEHTGGCTPFEADLTGVVEPGAEFRLTVGIDHRLTNVTIPPGTVTTGPDGRERQSYLHDFYNYACIGRPVRMDSTPTTFVEDVTVVTGRDGAAGTVGYRVERAGERTDALTVRVCAVDEAGRTVAEGEGPEGALRIEDVTLWQPGAAYLHDLVVELAVARETVDSCNQPFGVRPSRCAAPTSSSTATPSPSPASASTRTPPSGARATTKGRPSAGRTAEVRMHGVRSYVARGAVPSSGRRPKGHPHPITARMPPRSQNIVLSLALFSGTSP